jgi:prepilin-type N-terminal cleavage/methylation domain-containing protein
VNSYKAFSLIEVLLVVALVAILAIASASTLYNYYRVSSMDFELKTVTSRLQRVRQQAISNDSGSQYSVKFFAGRYVVFAGATYVEGLASNEEYQLTTNVLVSTSFTSDIITFDNFTGRTGVSGTLTLSAFDLNRVITINQLGIVEDIS